MVDAIGGGASTDAPDAADADATGAEPAGSADADSADAESAASADPSRPAASTDPSRSAASADAAPSLRRERLQALAGATVRGSDDESVGRVRDIYLHDASGELAAISVVRRQLSSRTVLIPVAAIAVLPAEQPAQGLTDQAAQGATGGTAQGASDTTANTTADKTADKTADQHDDDESAEAGHPQTVVLLVDAETARAGTRPPGTSHATPEMLREAARALGLQEASAG